MEKERVVRLDGSRGGLIAPGVITNQQIYTQHFKRIYWYVECSKMLDHNWDTSSVSFPCHFSNSLIIHQVKTKKITPVKENWIPGLNQHRF